MTDARAPALVTTFRTDVPVDETMAFEDVYEPELRMPLAEKRALVRDGIALWMFVDGALAGETYGVRPRGIWADRDCDTGDDGLVYCSSTTLLPAFRGRGLARVLCAYWLGLVRGAGFTRVAGHTTSPAMTRVKASFGAVFGATHERWGGTERIAHFYTLDV